MTIAEDVSNGFKKTEVGLIPSEWKLSAIDELAFVTKLAGFEFTKHIKYITDGEIIALRALNLNNGKLNLNDIKRISRKVSEELPRSKLRAGDLLLSYVGTVGSLAIVPEDNKFHLAPNVCKIVINDRDIADNSYLMFYLMSHKGKQELIYQTSKTSQPVISMAKIRKIKVPVPTLYEQQQISKILTSIDRKLESEETIKQALNTLFETLLSLLMTGNLRVKDLEISV